MSNLYVHNHPLVQHKLSLIRDQATGAKEFRELVEELAVLLTYEATRQLQLREVVIQTPVGPAASRVLAGAKICVIPILRAGLGMVSGLLRLIPTAKVGHIGVYRDPASLRPVEYYAKLPADMDQREVLLLDPMLATGGSAIAAVDYLKQRGARCIRFLCLIAAPEGIAALQAAHPDVDIHAAAVDQCLNDHAYIVPGLGDAGDRLFGTL